MQVGIGAGDCCQELCKDFFRYFFESLTVGQQETCCNPYTQVNVDSASLPDYYNIIYDWAILGSWHSNTSLLR